MKKTILFFIFLSFLLGGFIFVNAESEKLLISEKNSSQIGGDLLILLLKVKSIELNSDLFSEKSFISLKDFSVQIADQPVGRENPFTKI